MAVALMLGSAAFMGFAAFDEALLLDIANSSSRGAGAFLILLPFNIGGVNVAAVALVFYLGWVAWNFFRRLLDPVAVRIDGDVIRFHPTLRKKTVPIADVAGIDWNHAGLKSEFVVTKTDGTSVKVKNVDEWEAERAVEAWAATYSARSASQASSHLIE
ncbi:hypothetical protein [Alteriqipengyuania lutimaris]|uniref:hypothetical protein n=1 Tax=Alteriqipengyuania lutimaris TaxID=1538146 RepID=UPI0011C053B8|nr:hypothetical protein [Alteriqipengyuania lutimaris]MBB3033139.1 hypothetical protein [Alteriqipengyuania lutimaris]